MGSNGGDGLGESSGGLSDGGDGDRGGGGDGRGCGDHGGGSGAGGDGCGVGGGRGRGGGDGVLVATCGSVRTGVLVGRTCITFETSLRIHRDSRVSACLMLGT